MKNNKIIGIPQNEIVWVERISKTGESYYITSKADNRKLYYLYKLNGDKAVKIGKAGTPVELEDKYVDRGSDTVRGKEKI